MRTLDWKSIVLGTVFARAFFATPAIAEEYRPWQAELSYTADLMANVSGGINNDAAWLGRADAVIEVDGGAIGLSGSRLVLDIMYTHGPDFSARAVGDAQVVSNVQGDGSLRPIEAYVDFPVEDELSAKVGLIDLNTEFDIQTVGAFFTNSSHGIGIDFSQSGRNGPSIFPVTSIAAVMRWQSDRLRISGGLFNAVARDVERLDINYPGNDGWLVVGEAAFAATPRLQVQAGGWVYTSAETVIGISAERERGSRGAYAQLEASLAEWDGDIRLDAWSRIGTASQRTNRTTLYAGGGFTLGADRARFGAAVAHARQGSRAAGIFSIEEGPQALAETSIELGFAFPVAQFFTLQPVAHYVINPGWRADVPDAVVLGVRVSFATHY